MNTWYMQPSQNIAAMIAEDAGAPELRNPRAGAIRRERRLRRWLRKTGF